MKDISSSRNRGPNNSLKRLDDSIMSKSPSANGQSPTESEQFDRDLQEVMETAPTLNESNEVVHTGSVSQTSKSDAVTPPSQPAVRPTSLPANTLRRSWVPQANTNIPLSSPSPSQNGDNSKSLVTKPSRSKFDSIKQWSISTYKCTKQVISEKLGKSTRTVDTEMEAQIEQLRETQNKYTNILQLAQALVTHFSSVVETQQYLGEAFSELAQKSPELQEEFLYNAETQRNLSKNGETLLGALQFFVSTLNTLCNKTIDDTLLTIKQYEIARLEYDAYRTDMEEAAQSTAGNAVSPKLDEAKKKFNIHKEKYEKLRSDVTVKMKFLDENKVKVMHKQLLLFHNAISAYFSGNQAMLDATLKQFNIKLKNPNASSPSWLEK
ncbi:arfaptin-2-like [Centruroides vittatus]|uniref:arfaptin-2-like n=1 Tax=Centruroides vittatus TaxID=120091 RepID=UPI00350F9A04